MHCGVCYFENNFSFLEINDNDFKWKCESSYIITKKKSWMHVILCDLCMYDHEERKKIVLLAQKLRRKKLRIRKEIPIFVPGRRSSSWWPNIKKSSTSFWKKKKITHNELLKTRWNDIWRRRHGNVFISFFDIITPLIFVGIIFFVFHRKTK